MKREEIRRIVEELNEIIYKSPYYPSMEFSYCENSYDEWILLGDVVVWGHDNDDRKYDDETEEKIDLKVHLAGVIENMIGDLSIIANALTKELYGHRKE